MSATRNTSNNSNGGGGSYRNNSHNINSGPSSSSSSPYNNNNNPYLRHSNNTSGGGGGGGGPPNRSPPSQFFQRGGSGSSYSQSHSRHGSGSSGGGSGGRRSGGGGFDRDRSHLPLEQGVVRTLKESFGFIQCVDRPEDIFFHFSELVLDGSDWKSAMDVQISDPVEFRVGTKGNAADSKLAAFQVRRLNEPIVWEVPQGRVRGLVERPSRPAGGEGSIRVLVESTTTDQSSTGDAAGAGAAASGGDAPPPASSSEVSTNDPSVSVEKLQGPLVKYGLKDCSKRLSRGDLVEFDMVVVRRTKDNVARNIHLLVSEQQRQQEERERRLLETAVEEHGIVTALKGEYGFIRSNKRREEVYFHYSSVHVGEDEKMILQEGQDMKFLVVNHDHDAMGGGGGGGHLERSSSKGKRISARRVQLQPRGSVKFHDAVACGVTGVVTICPQPVDAGHSLEARGRVQLTTPVTMDNDDDSDVPPRVITEVYLASADSPGGTYAFRGGTSVATWVQVGDTLLFDVVKDYVDGACHAAPTIHLLPNPNPMEIEEERPDDVRKVRLIEVSMVGRAHGIINAVKESYGFLHFAERPVDVHFKLYQLLPDELQQDIRRNRGLSNVDDRGKPLRLSLDTEAEFDISVHGTIHATANHHKHSKKMGPSSSHERENLKAQRVLLLPPNTFQITKVLATKVRGKVSKEDPKQAYAGMVDLDVPIEPISIEERHPLVSKMLDDYLSSDWQAPLVYHDVQSSREEETVFELIDVKAKGKLTWTHLPQPGETMYPGRLCLRKADATSIETVSDDALPPRLSTSTPAQEESHEPDEAEGATDSDDKSQSGDDASRDGGKKSRRSTNKKRPAVKLIRAVRYDKSSLSVDVRDGIPPACDDIVEFDVVQSRRTMQVSVENLTIVERKNATTALPVETTATEGIGVVTEVVISRNFGLIAVLDESATKRESIFFSFTNVVGFDKSNKKKKTPCRKGDEVKFEIRIENGKRVAINVSPLPKGTIPFKAAENACRGLVLLEPTNTNLNNNCSGASGPRNSRHSATASDSEQSISSRWDTTSDDGNKARSSFAESGLKGDGCILLLDDPSKLFSIVANPESVVVEESSTSDYSGEPLRVSYTSGALAIQGPGSSTSSDDASYPRRGDVVTFVRSNKKDTLRARDVRLVTRGAAQLVRGRLEDIHDGTAKFVVSTAGEEVYHIQLSDVVSCDVTLLKEKESVEGILHNNQLYGICRTCDLYLESKVRASALKERPKLNLTVKKDRGGTIMAQSMMAKGPDGTLGFHAGWTNRKSPFAIVAEAESTNHHTPPSVVVETTEDPRDEMPQVVSPSS